jgi:hypothetical protein
VVINDTEYHPLAIEVARKIIEEKKLTNDFSIYLEDNNIQLEQDDEQLTTEYYKDLVDLKNNYKYFDLKLEDAVKFEKKLIEYKLPFYKEKELITVRNSKELIQSYLFKNEYFEKVNQIVIELDILLKSQHDTPGLHMFEIITILILLITIILMMFLK